MKIFYRDFPDNMAARNNLSLQYYERNLLVMEEISHSAGCNFGYLNYFNSLFESWCCSADSHRLALKEKALKIVRKKDSFYFHLPLADTTNIAGLLFLVIESNAITVIAYSACNSKCNKTHIISLVFVGVYGLKWFHHFAVVLTPWKFSTEILCKLGDVFIPTSTFHLHERSTRLHLG